MTVLVALERLSLDDGVVVPPSAARDRRVDARAAAGQRVTVRDLVIGALVPSANDAATALAVARGRERCPLRRADEPQGARARARRHPLREPARARRSRATSRPRATRPAAPRRAPGPDHRALRRRSAARRSPTAASSSRPTTCSDVSAARRRQDGAHGARRVVAGRDSPAPAASGSPPPCSARRPRRSATRDLAALLRLGLAQYRPVAGRRPRPDVRAAPTPAGGSAPFALVAPRAVVRAAPIGRPLVERVVAPGGRALPVAAGAAARRRSSSATATALVARSPLVAGARRSEPDARAEGAVGRRRARSTVW